MNWFKENKDEILVNTIAGIISGLFLMGFT